MSERQERAARNESLFREVNEQIEKLNAKLAAQHGRFLCECASADCASTVELTLDAYETVRSAADRFVLAGGHEQPDVERVIERTDDYIVVEKTGEAGELAAELDPRG